MSIIKIDENCETLGEVRNIINNNFDYIKDLSIRNESLYFNDTKIFSEKDVRWFIGDINYYITENRDGWGASYTSGSSSREGTYIYDVYNYGDILFKFNLDTWYYSNYESGVTIKLYVKKYNGLEYEEIYNKYFEDTVVSVEVPLYNLEVGDKIKVYYYKNSYARFYLTNVGFLAGNMPNFITI